MPESWYDILAWDKVGHFGFYLILVFLFLQAKVWQNQTIKSKYMVGVVVGASLYGTLLEFVQYKYFPDRYFEYADMTANMIGAIAGNFVHEFYLKNRERFSFLK